MEELGDQFKVVLESFVLDTICATRFRRTLARYSAEPAGQSGTGSPAYLTGFPLIPKVIQQRRLLCICL